jgi:adenine-specific DNA-methyltransferase
MPCAWPIATYHVEGCLLIQPSNVKKQNGVYYSPAEITAILCSWAIRSPHDMLLEPSFGGCGFLRACIQRLQELGSANPGTNLFGCDISDEAFCYLRNTHGLHPPPGHFLQTDFLSLEPPAFLGQEFDAVIGNPPYVSHHNMGTEQKRSVQSACKANDWQLDKKASLWTYFVLHSMRFLKPGGRAAWLLPASMIFADYGRQVRELLFRRFDKCLVVWIGERLFLTEGTEERTVVLLCEGYDNDEKVGSKSFGYVANVSDLEMIIGNWRQGLWKTQYPEGRPVLVAMGAQARANYMDLVATPDTTLLGNLCKIQIGIVTGANEFFIIDSATATTANLPDEVLSPILAKFHFASGLAVTAEDINLARERKERCLLVDTSGVEEISGALAEYLASFPADKLDSIKTFKKRIHWHRPSDERIPDAFFPYMQDSGPWLVQNTAKLLSTNTVHRVFFNDSVTPNMRKLVAISILSTFSQLSAEIEGRIYGSGVLKHEPSEAERIAILLPSGLKCVDIDSAFASIDKLWRTGQKDEAHRKADEFILRHFYHDVAKRAEVVALLTEQLAFIRSMRRTAK